MKMSDELIKFFIKVAILAAADSATVNSSEGEDASFERVTLDERKSDIA